MKDNTLKIALIVGGGLLAYYFYNKCKQQKVATQPVFLDGEEQVEEERQEMPMGGGGGGGFSPTPTPTVTPAVIIATTSPVTNTLPIPSTAPSTPAPLINLAPAPSMTQPAPSSQLAPSPSPMVSPIVKPMASPKPFVSQALMGTNLLMPKSPFSGMDGRNSYDIDAKLDL